MVALGVLIVVLVVIGAVGGKGNQKSTDSAAKSTPQPTTTSPAPTQTVASSPTGSSPVALAPVAGIVAAADAGAAVARLAELQVQDPAPRTGYARSLFGETWTDDVTVAGGHNGCDTRNDVLRRDLSDVTLKPDSNGCAVMTGTLADPYTAATIPFERSQSSSDRIQVDHVVALANAWQTGAQQWDEQTRRNFANDPINLQSTAGAANQANGDGDAAIWLPRNTEYRCTYVSRQIDVKATYRLWVTSAEYDAMIRVLGECGATTPTPVAQPTEETSTVTIPTRDVVPAYTPPPTPTYTAPLVAPVDGARSVGPFGSCAQARAAGAAPLYAGEPGYTSKLDRDGDGVACE